MFHEVKQKVRWEGKATFSDSDITEEQYNNYFDTDAITYNIARSTLKACCGTPNELTIDYLHSVARNEAINEMTYGEKWLHKSNFKDMPNIHFTIKIAIGNQLVDFYTLPVEVRRYISTSIVENDQFSGELFIIQKRS